MQDKKKKKSGEGKGKDFIRFKQNPFVDGDTHYPGKTKRTSLRRSANSDVSMYNTQTGEEFNTAIVMERRVDSEKFVKIFVNEISSLLEMKPAGQKLLIMLMWAMHTNWKINKDTVALDQYALEDYSAHLKEKGVAVFTRRTLSQGIKELVDNNVIAAHQKRGWFFINPAFVWNGDRMTYIRDIHRDESLDNKDKYNDQMDLLEGGK